MSLAGDGLPRYTWRRGAILIATAALSCGRTAVSVTATSQDLSVATDLSVPADRRLPHLLDAAWPTCDRSSAPAALVDGTTPGGTFHGRFAYLAFVFGGCPFPNVLVTESPLPPAPDGGVSPGQHGTFLGEKGLYIQLNQGNSGYDWGGVGQCAVTYNEGFRLTARCEGVQTGSPSEPGPGEGTLLADGSGWNLSGWYCAQRRPDYDDTCLP